MSDGWPNEATARVATQIREDSELEAEVRERVNALAHGSRLPEAVQEAAAEVRGVIAGGWVDNGNRPADADDVDWSALGEAVLISVATRTPL